MPHASTVSEPKKGIVVKPQVTVNVAPSAADIHQFRQGREARLQAQFDHRTNPPDYEAPDISGFEPIDILDLPDSFYISVIGSRRSGKSFLVNWMLQQFQSGPRHFTHVFLISPTDSGFKGIPKRYRFKTIETAYHIINTQRKIKAHNKKMHHARDRVKSRICVVIDDCACMSGRESLRNSKILEEMALNGRHEGHPIDPEPGNGINWFILSQSLTRISRAIRLNQDCFIFNNISSAKERELILDECFFINTRRDAKRESRNLYETLAGSKDFRFICVSNYIQNKRTHQDFIRVVDAVELPDKQLFGTKSDDEDSDSEDDEKFSRGKPRQLPGGRDFISGGKFKYQQY